MKRIKIKLMLIDELHCLSTRQLLARLRRLNQCQQSRELSDLEANVAISNEEILFKDSIAWQIAYQQVKEVLSKREHIIKGHELKEQRLQRAKLNKT